MTTSGKTSPLRETLNPPRRASSHPTRTARVHPSPHAMCARLTFNFSIHSRSPSLTCTPCACHLRNRPHDPLDEPVMATATLTPIGSRRMALNSMMVDFFLQYAAPRQRTLAAPSRVARPAHAHRCPHAHERVCTCELRAPIRPCLRAQDASSGCRRSVC